MKKFILALSLLLLASPVWAATITITVTPGANATSHRIEKQIGAGAYLPLTTLVMPAVEFIDTAVSVGNVYSYRAVAITTLGESAPSVECTHAVLAAGPPVVSCGVNP